MSSQRKDRHDEHELLRLLAGELDAGEARRVRRRLAEEPELAATWERLRGTWRQVDLPSEPLPPGFAGRVMSRLRDEAAGRRGLAARLALWRAPAWAQAAGATALAGGLALGVLLGSGLAPVLLPAPAVAPAPAAAPSPVQPATGPLAAAEDPAEPPTAEPPADALAADDYADYFAADDGDTLADAYYDALSAFGEEES